MKNLLLVIAVASFSLQAVASTEIDSLRQVWNNAEMPDSSRLEAANLLIWKYYMSNDLDSAGIVAQLNLDRAEEIGLNEHIGKSSHGLATYYVRKGDFKLAHEYYDLALGTWRQLDNAVFEGTTLQALGNLYRKQGDIDESIRVLKESLNVLEKTGDRKRIASTLLHIGGSLKVRGDYAGAIEYYSRGQRIREEMNDKNGVANVLKVIGSVYYSFKEYDLALQYFERSLELCKELGDKQGIASASNNVGLIHLEEARLQEAIRNFNSGLDVARSAGFDFIETELLCNLGEAYSELEDIVTALEFYKQTIQKAEEVGSSELQAYALWGIGKIRLEQENPLKAIEQGEKAMRFAEESEQIEIQKSVSLLLYEAYKLNKDLTKALRMYERHVALSDSLNKEENQRAVLRQEFKYNYEKEALTDSLEYAKKESVMTERSEKQRLGLFAAGGGLLLLLGLAFAIYSGKKKSDELLLNILPYETAQELKQKGNADAKLIDDVTVLFTDFKGFTALSEQLSPKDLVEDLNECFSEFDRIMGKHGIEKIKTIGDAYMAAGGLPTPNTTHASDVVTAALEMRDFVEEGKRRKFDAGLPYFEVRIGVHSGPVVAGIVGIKKFQYDIWGDTVNTASRMESSGQVGKVNISEATYKLLVGTERSRSARGVEGKDGASAPLIDQVQFSFENRGKIEAKGKGEMEMYFVERSEKA